MSWNNYNISIPSIRVPLGELVCLTTGTTWTDSAGAKASPGRIYEDYVCTELTAMSDDSQLQTNSSVGQYWQKNLITQESIRLYGAGLGETIKWNFTGRDIIGWGNKGATQLWMATCFCTNPCTNPRATKPGPGPGRDRLTGNTMNYNTGQYRTTQLGGTAFQNVNLH